MRGLPASVPERGNVTGTITDMPELGRAALVVALGLVLYAALAGGYAALRGRPRLRRLALHHSAGSGGRRGAQSEPPEPVHDGSPAAALPRLCRAHDSVCVCDGGTRIRPNGRALDHRHAPLDTRVVDLPRLRHPSRRQVGL